MFSEPFQHLLLQILLVLWWCIQAVEQENSDAVVPFNHVWTISGDMGLKQRRRILLQFGRMRIDRRKGGKRLRRSVFDNREIVPSQIGNSVTIMIGNHCIKRNHPSSSTDDQFTGGRWGLSFRYGRKNNSTNQ